MKKSWLLAIPCFAILAGIFAWLFYENLLFIDSFDLLGICDIDDFTFHFERKRQQDLMLAGQWVEVFQRVSYGYGNLYWNLISLSTLPFYLAGMDSWVMALPRQISLFFSATILWMFFLICRTLRYPTAHSALALLLVISNGFLVATAVRFHNHNIIATFYLAAVYALLLPQSRKHRLWACLLFGVAFGIKLTALFGAPAIILLLNKDKKWAWKKIILLRNMKSNLAYSAIVLITWMVVYCPASLLIFFGNKMPLYYAYEQTKFFVVKTLNPVEVVPLSAWENLNRGFFAQSLHLYASAIALALCVFLLFKYRRKSINQLAVPLMGLLSLTAVLILSEATHSDWYAAGAYAIGIIALIPLVFVEFSRLMPKLSYVLLLAVISLNLYLNFDHYQFYLNGPYRIRYSEPTAKLLEDFHKFKSVKLDGDDRVLLDFRLVFPLDAINRKHQPASFFDDASFPEPFPFNVFIIRKAAPLWNKNCAETQKITLLPIEKCREMKNLLAGKTGYKVIYHDDTAVVLRKPL